MLDNEEIASFLMGRMTDIYTVLPQSSPLVIKLNRAMTDLCIHVNGHSNQSATGWNGRISIPVSGEAYLSGTDSSQTNFKIQSTIQGK